MRPEVGLAVLDVVFNCFKGPAVEGYNANGESLLYPKLS